MKNRPAMKFCLPFLVGILIGWKFVFSPSMLIVVAVALFFIIVVLHLLRRDVLIPSLVTFLLVLFGVLKITIDARVLPDDNIRHELRNSASVTLRGTVVDLPRIVGKSLRFVLEVDSIFADSHSKKSSGEVLVSLRNRNLPSDFALSLSYGKTLQVHGELVSVGRARNPGEFDAGTYYYLNGIYARCNVEDPADIVIVAESPGGFNSTVVYPVRKSLAARIDALFPHEEAQFLKGLLIGERSEIPLEIKNAFINAGVMHIIAVSGLHVALVVIMLMVFLRLLRLPETVCIVLTCVLLVYYGFLTGNTASVVRSVIMGIAFLGGKLLEHRTDIYNTLAISAIIILLIDARQLFQAGFQLSFVAVFALVYFSPKVYEPINRLPERFRKSKRYIQQLSATRFEYFGWRFKR